MLILVLEKSALVFPATNVIVSGGATTESIVFPDNVALSPVATMVAEDVVAIMGISPFANESVAITGNVEPTALLVILS